MPLLISRPDNQDLKKPDNPVINRPFDKDVKNQQDKTASQNPESRPAVNADDFKKEHDALISMIPEPMRKPVIVSLVDRYHLSHGFEHTADAILYTNGRPKKEGNGNWQSYRGHLSKGLAGHYEGIAGIYRTVLEKETEEENIRIKKAEAEKRRAEEQRKKAELEKNMEAFSRMKEALFWSRFNALPEDEQKKLTEKFLIIKEKNIIIQRYYREQGIKGAAVREAFRKETEAALLSEQERSFEHFTANRQAPVMPAVIN